MTDRLEPISETELRVLRVLWEQGPGTVRQINGKLRREPGTFELPRPKLDIPGIPAISPLLFLGLLAAGSLLLALFPGFTDSSLRALGHSPLKSLVLHVSAHVRERSVRILELKRIIGITEVTTATRPGVGQNRNVSRNLRFAAWQLVAHDCAE